MTTVRGNSRRGVRGKSNADSPSRRIDRRIQELGGWRGDTLARMRALILAAVPGVVEEWKWNVPVWSMGGILCTGEAYAKVVKLTFARGASLPDPSGRFNSSLEGKTRRAIDIREGETVNAAAFKRLVKAAAALNRESTGKSAGAGGGRTPVGRMGVARRGASSKVATMPVKLLSGGNPQIAKGDGDEPVQAYIAAMPDWKRDVGRRLDALITRSVPGVRKAVRWNSPFYGVEGRGWFVSFHVFTRFVKVTFFNGASLKPPPPGATPKSGEARWIDLLEGDPVDDARMTKWLKQAARLPGWTP
jgi:hypothetical protein